MEKMEKMKKANPFDECPVYETGQFRYRLVREEDAEDLFLCYCDPVTWSHMNADNCNGKPQRMTRERMKDWIRLWQRDYQRRTFLRWSVLCKDTGKAAGTMEIAPLPWGRWFFGTPPPIGILRMDLLSVFERQEVLSEIIGLMASELANDFEVNQVIMKAPPDEPEKVNALLANQFQPYPLRGFQHYYAKRILLL
jgi:hypothetical protein